VLRDLRRIHSHICSVAYPVLDAAGEPYRRTETETATLPDSGAASALPR
jgi:phosphate:Na+ symporter